MLHPIPVGKYFIIHSYLEHELTQMKLAEEEDVAKIEKYYLVSLGRTGAAQAKISAKFGQNGLCVSAAIFKMASWIYLFFEILNHTNILITDFDVRISLLILSKMMFHEYLQPIICHQLIKNQEAKIQKLGG